MHVLHNEKYAIPEGCSLKNEETFFVWLQAQLPRGVGFDSRAGQGNNVDKRVKGMIMW